MRSARKVRLGVVLSKRITDLQSYEDAAIEHAIETQFGAGRLYAIISSRPGQSGRADGYILEGKELEVSGRRHP